MGIPALGDDACHLAGVVLDELLGGRAVEDFDAGLLGHRAERGHAFGRRVGLGAEVRGHEAQVVAGFGEQRLMLLVALVDDLRAAFRRTIDDPFDRFARHAGPHLEKLAVGAML